MSEAKQKFLTYKGRPLVRSKKVIYYGDMREDYVVMLQISSTKEENGIQVPSHITMQMMSTNPDVPPTEMVLKRAERDGFYNSLDLASTWLDRQLGEVKE